MSIVIDGQRGNASAMSAHPSSSTPAPSVQIYFFFACQSGEIPSQKGKKPKNHALTSQDELAKTLALRQGHGHQSKRVQWNWFACKRKNPSPRIDITRSRRRKKSNFPINSF
jgi:hypothetical protein